MSNSSLGTKSGKLELKLVLSVFEMGLEARLVFWTGNNGFLYTIVNIVVFSE